MAICKAAVLLAVSKVKKRTSSAKRKPAKRAAAARRPVPGKVGGLALRRTLPGGVKKRGRPAVHGDTTQRSSTSRSPRLRIPRLLFEGDRPAPSPLAGPGEKFALGKHPKAREVAIEELPETYGTGRLFVTCRDPHWLSYRSSIPANYSHE